MFDHTAIRELTKAEAISAANLAAAASALALVPLPNDFTVHDLEAHLQVRRRARGNMSTSSIAHFATYVLAHREAGASVFVDAARMSATAVLNLGTPDAPGQADNTATLQPVATAAYTAMLAVADGAGKAQRAVAEWLEDWQDTIQALDADGAEITTKHAIAAVRSITIEALRTAESTEQSLSATRSALEQVTAKSKGQPLPALLRVGIEPYAGIDTRTFDLRLGVLTTTDKPALVLRIVKREAHTEAMAGELATKVRAALGDVVPALLGAYSKGR